MSFFQEMSTDDLLASLKTYRQGFREAHENEVLDMLAEAIALIQAELEDRGASWK